MWHLAGYYRGQTYGDDPVSFARHSAGIQGGVAFLGVELGWENRTAFGALAAVNGFHVSPYVSAGILYFGPSLLVPIGGDQKSTEVAMNLGLKFPLPQLFIVPILALGNWSHMPSGRPLRVDGRAIVGEVVAGSAWREGRSPRLDALSAAARRKLAKLWLDAGRLEHASIAAFESLAEDLGRLGAPRPLIARARRAAKEETRHARRCFTLASAYAGEPLDPAPLARPERRRAIDVVQLAIESFADGCIGEGAGAAMAAIARSRATDPAVRAALAIIARDEAGHAALAWDVIGFCRARGGDAVDRALLGVAVRVRGARPKRSRRTVKRAIDGHGWLALSARIAIEKASAAAAVTRLERVPTRGRAELHPRSR
jgi:hypothetical protein